jgi:hypothetical protein
VQSRTYPFALVGFGFGFGFGLGFINHCFSIWIRDDETGQFMVKFLMTMVMEYI